MVSGNNSVNIKLIGKQNPRYKNTHADQNFCLPQIFWSYATNNILGTNFTKSREVNQPLINECPSETLGALQCSVRASAFSLRNNQSSERPVRSKSLKL